MRQVNFGQVANSYAKSREDIPNTLMDSLFIRNIHFNGKKVADLAAGSGALTRKIAMRRGNVIGVESSAKLREQALVLNKIKNFQIQYINGTAEATGLEDSQYDMVTVRGAWHWFDRMKAIQEIKRILKKNGTLIVIDSDFLSGSETVEKSFSILQKYAEGGLKPAGSKADSKQRLNGLPVEWFEEWQSNGFELRDFFKLNYMVQFTREEWIESVFGQAGLEEKVRLEALRELDVSLSENEIYQIPHECNVCILKTCD